MAGAKPRMASLLDVALRPAESVDEKIAEPLLGGCEVVGWIHWTEHVIVRHSAIKSSHHTRDSLLANSFEDFVLLHSICQ